MVQPKLRQRIIDAQLGDTGLRKILNELVTKPVDGYSKSSDDGLLYQGRLCVPVVEELQNEIIGETHNFPFTMHPDKDVSRLKTTFFVA